MSRAFRFAWLSTVRQPARTALGVLGVAAVGALLFDMLLLSRGLVVSFRDLLDRAGFDVRVLATDAVPFSGPRLEHAAALAAALARLPEVEAVQRVRVADAEVENPGRVPDARHTTSDAPDADDRIAFIAGDPGMRSMWTLLEGRDLRDAGVERPVIVNRHLARARSLRPGSVVRLTGRCQDTPEAMPAVAFTVAGIAEFPFDSPRDDTAAGTLESLSRLCGDRERDRADLLLVRSTAAAGADAAAAAIRRAQPGLHVVTNSDIVERFSRVDFSYFRELSVVLATVTLSFGVLLIAVLLTVSVNQRLAEIATLRAVGLTRARVLAGILWESALLVGAGGALAVPAGFALSIWLESILRRMPGIPVGLQFFVFEPRAMVLHAVLLAVAAAGAAAYPMRIVATLPIAATLRQETVS